MFVMSVLLRINFTARAPSCHDCCLLRQSMNNSDFQIYGNVTWRIACIIKFVELHASFTSRYVDLTQFIS